MKICYYLILILLCTSCVFSKDVTITFIQTDGSEKTQIINQEYIPPPRHIRRLTNPYFLKFQFLILGITSDFLTNILMN